MTSSNENIFRVTGHLCGEFTGPGEFPTQRPVTRSFDVFFDLRLNKWLRQPSRGWWFETQSWSLWRHCNDASTVSCVDAVDLHMSCYMFNTTSLGGHRTRVAAVTLDNMAEDAVAASASLWQILTVSVRYCGPAFVSWLSMLWDILTLNSELQWFGISPQFWLKLSRGDEGVGHVCFPGMRVSVGPDEGTAVCRWA